MNQLITHLYYGWTSGCSLLWSWSLKNGSWERAQHFTLTSARHSGATVSHSFVSMLLFAYPKPGRKEGKKRGRKKPKIDKLIPDQREINKFKIYVCPKTDARTTTTIWRQSFGPPARLQSSYQASCFNPGAFEATIEGAYESTNIPNSDFQDSPD